jgi:hypothetical protein
MQQGKRNLKPLSGVPEGRQRWLMPGRIPLGALTTLEGHPGCFKSGVMYWIAARVSRGEPLPGCSVGGAAAGVVLLQGEDDLAARVAPALAAAGADADRVFVYDRADFGDRPLELPGDLPVIEEAAKSVGGRLIIIDPVSCFVPDLGSERAARRALGPLADFAARAGAAVILVRHLTKSSSPNPLLRGAGSIGLIAAVRSALLATADPASDDPARGLLVQIKNSFGPLALPLAYRAGRTAEWLGEVACVPLELAAAEEKRSAFAEATLVVYVMLRDGPLPAREALRQVKDAGVAKRTLDRARAAMKVHAHKPGAAWVWELPDDPALLRHAIELERAERMRQVRREVAGLKVGALWVPPERDGELHQEALGERGLAVVRVLGRYRLLRAADAGRAALLEQLLLAAESGGSADRAALGDLLAELGIEASTLTP